MQKLSRVKKYEELRKSIELDNNINSTSNNEDNQAKELLHSFDASVLKKADIRENSNFGKREKTEDFQNQVNMSSDDTFTNEYLDDFLKEVRDYNIRKGTRQCEDTEVDILYQLNDANRAKRNRSVHEIKDNEENYRKNNSNTIETILSKEQIAEEVKNLIFDETPVTAKETEEVSNEEESTIEPTETDQDESLTSIEETIEVSPIIDDQVDHNEDIVTNEVEENKDESPNFEEDGNQQTTFHQKFIEETQQIRVQMNEYEDELTDLSDGVEKTNKLLNFVLGFLILVLLVVIGFIGFSIWSLGGF